MSAIVQDGLRRARSAMAGFTPGQIGVIVIGVAGLVLAAFAFMRWSAPSLSPLYSNLSTEDAAAVVQQLDTTGTAYELQDGGTTILVPQDKVYATRLAMSSQGLPANTGGGYALLDQQGITTSEFMQNVTYQRALEGELAKTIEAIDGVKAASVHLALPEKSVFTQDSDKPTAAVMVTMGAGTELSDEQVTAIQNLVASSVPQLTTANVTITDSSGALLSTTGTGGGSSASSQIRAQRAVEGALEVNAQSLLEKALGVGNVAVRVNAALDFDQWTRTDTSYEYPKTIPPSSQTNSTETFTGSGAVPGGIVGVGNGTTTAGTGTGTTAGSTTGSGNQYQKTTNTQDNLVNSIIEQRTGAPGSVKRLTVSVLVNGAAGSVDTTALTTAVANAVGFDATRGDAIQVTPMKFDTSATDAAAAAEAAAADAESKTMLFDLVKKAGIILLVLIVIVLAFLSSRKQKRQLLDAEELGALGFAPQPLAITRGSDAAPLDAVVLPADEPKAIEKQKSDIHELVATQPDEVAQLLRGWIASGR
ncbi:MAG: flagellar M-ring protein FliF [Actinobacteria bacterium]|nr:flagellar M-ring protein FliF [Actinomycetota bacterium]